VNSSPGFVDDGQRRKAAEFDEAIDLGQRQTPSSSTPATSRSVMSGRAHARGGVILLG